LKTTRRKHSQAFIDAELIDVAKIQYRFPMPPDGKKTQFVEILPITPLGGEGGI
jgi:hypothetical protein